MAAEVTNQPHDMEMEVSDSESVEADGNSQAHGEDDEFAFGDEYSSRDDSSPMKSAGGGGGGGGAKQKAPMIKPVHNQPFDAKVELDDEESVEGSPEKSGHSSMDSDASPPARQPPPQQKKSDPPPPAAAQQQQQKVPMASLGGGAHPQPRGEQQQQQQHQSGQSEKSDEEEEDEEEESSEEDEESGAQPGYNPNDYAHLKVSPEIKELFDYIGRFKPQTIELETKLKPFIPEYIPAVGEIDAFLKIPRPERVDTRQPDPLGITTLDEPGPVQTDPAVLDLIIRQSTKTAALHPTPVSNIENASHNPKAINTWISNINSVHKDKPAPNVNYTRPMPDIEQLMQVWPLEVEDAMHTLQLPTAELDVDVNAYARIVCSLLDIPVHNNLTESLHVLFTLYLEFKDNQHFNDGGGGGFDARPQT